MNIKAHLMSLAGLTTLAVLLGACGGDDDKPACTSFPVGVYNVVSGNFHGDTGACVTIASLISGKAQVVSISKVSDTSYEVNDGSGAPTTMTLDTGTCTISSTSQTTVDGVDLAGKAVKLKTVNTTTVSSSGDTLTIDRRSEVSTDTVGAQGYPCTVTGTATGVIKH